MACCSGRWIAFSFMVQVPGGAPSSDPDLGVGQERIGRQRQICRRRSAANAARRIVLGTVTGAEPAVVIALVRQRNAAEVGADADQDQPLIVTLLDPRLIGLRIRQRVPVDVARLFDFLRRAMVDEDRFAAPEHLDDLTFRDRGEVDFDGSPGGDGRLVRIHLRDQRPDRRREGGGAGGRGRDIEKIAACRFGRSGCGGHGRILSCRSIRPRCEPGGSGRSPPAADGPAAAGPEERRQAARSGGVLLAPLLGSCKPSMAAPTTDRRPMQIFAAPHAPSARIPVWSDEPAMGAVNEVMPIRLALFQPDIAPNTATILRLCACLGIEAHIIEPAGFPVSDRAFRRAGMDYLERVALVRHVSWDAFEAWRAQARLRLVLVSTRAALSYVEYAFRPEDVLLFGRESAGAPEAVHAAADARLKIPMRPGLRSLNVAVAAAMVLGEALRQLGGFPMQDVAGESHYEQET